MCNTNTPPPPLSKATFPSLTVCLHLLDSTDWEWCLRQAFKHNFGFLWDLELWPPKPRGRPLMPLPGGGDICQFTLRSVHSFSKCVLKLVTDKRTNKRTDERTKGQVENIVRPTSLDWPTDKYSICSVSVLRSCGFTTLRAFCPSLLVFRRLLKCELFHRCYDLC